MIYWAGLMALAWTALQGNVTPANLIGGFALSWIILRSLRPFEGSRRPIRWRTLPTLRLLAYFFRELIVSNWTVVREIFAREPLRHRAILEIPLEPDTDLELTTLANMVTLTPGTLSLQVSRDRRRLFVHSLFASAEREDEIIAGIKKFERLIREAV